MTNANQEVTMIEQGGAVTMPEAVSVLQIIERAARDPSVDIDKMERLMQMHERMLARNAETAYNAALSAMQTELPEMPEHGKIRNKSGNVQSKYALWEDMNKIIKPILTKHGFALTFRTGNEGANIVVTGVLSHAAGHSITSTMQLPMDASGSKNEVQGLGSSTSYGKRYVAGALLNLTSRGEDNDGAGSQLMPETVKADFLAAVEALADMEGWNSLWQKITAATTAVGDIATHEELRGAMAARRKILTAKVPK